MFFNRQFYLFLLKSLAIFTTFIFSRIDPRLDPDPMLKNPYNGINTARA
jgi:hypothetical protein